MLSNVNVPALLITRASLMLFFLIQAETKKIASSLKRFFWLGGFLGVC